MISEREKKIIKNPSNLKMIYYIFLLIVIVLIQFVIGLIPYLIVFIFRFIFTLKVNKKDLKIITYTLTEIYKINTNNYTFVK